MKKPNGARSESVAVVPVLIDCQGDWVPRIYLAYARTTPRNDAGALQHVRQRNYSHRVHDYALSCENRFIDGLSDLPATAEGRYAINATPGRQCPIEWHQHSYTKYMYFPSSYLFPIICTSCIWKYFVHLTDNLLSMLHSSVNRSRIYATSWIWVPMNPESAMKVVIGEIMTQLWAYVESIAVGGESVTYALPTPPRDRRMISTCWGFSTCSSTVRASIASLPRFSRCISPRREINQSKSETRRALNFIRSPIWFMKISTDFFLCWTNARCIRCTQLESICVANLLFNAAAVIGVTNAPRCCGNVMVQSRYQLFA